MDIWAPGTPTPPRIGDARSRRQRRVETMQRYAAALTQPTTPTTPTSMVPNPTPQFSNPRGRISGLGPPQSHLHRHRLRRQETGESFETIQETLNDLENDRRRSHLHSAGLNQTLPIPTGVDEFTGLEENLEDDGRRHKRRKVDGELYDPMPKISYGYRGQVVPGRLNMMISYLDAGIHHDEKQYSQDNILKNDKSVYCSRKNKVNIMLSHWGEVPFTCTKIIIKTPDSGFSAPPQEGMIFILSNGNSDLESTYGFQLQEHPSELHRGSTPPTSDPTRRGVGLQSGSDSRQIPSSSTSDRNRRRAFPATMEEALSEFGFDAFLSEPNLSSQVEPVAPLPDDMPPLTRVSRRLIPPPTISTYEPNISLSCDPPTDNEEDPTPDSVLDDRRRRNHIFESDSENESDEPRHPLSNRIVRQYSQPRPINWILKSSILSSGDYNPPGPHVPYTRFFIEQKKHVISIKFNPPVSARNVFFKFWSPQGKERVDLQSIGVYGFAGPRFFPVLETR